MISALPVLIVIWAILTALFLALLAYNGTVTRYEENQLFLADINANEQQQQHTIVRKVRRPLGARQNHPGRLVPYLQAGNHVANRRRVFMTDAQTMRTCCMPAQC